MSVFCIQKCEKNYPTNSSTNATIANALKKICSKVFITFECYFQLLSKSLTLKQ